MYIATSQGQTSPGDKILMSTETTCHFGHLLQVSKKISFKSDFIQFFFIILYMYIAPGLISSHLSPLTFEVVGVPQMTLQQYLSTLPCLPLPSGNLQTPFPSIPWCYLPISSSVFLSFLLLSLSPAELSLPCPRILRCGHTIWVSVSLPWLGDHHALQLHSVANLLVCDIVFAGNVQKSSIVSQLKSLDPSLNFCCWSPALTGIKEGR